jgi:cation transporter-like permease
VEHSPNPVPLPLAVQHYLSTIRRDLFNLRRHSLVRASALVLLSLAAALVLSDFPNNRPNLLLILPALLASLGTADTIRCMQTRWSYYHAGVILCVYMDIMAVGMIVFFLLYPYMSWLSSTSQTR